MFNKSFYIRQNSSQECGLTCLRMILKYHGKFFRARSLREHFITAQGGISLFELKTLANLYKLDTDALELTHVKDIFQLQNYSPFICYWNNRHFVVISEIKPNYVTCYDPAKGVYRLKISILSKKMFNVRNEAYVLLLSKAKDFDSLKEDHDMGKDFIRYLKAILNGKAIYFLLLFLCLIFVLLLLYILPIIKKEVFDQGVNFGLINLIKYLLIGQLAIICGQLVFNTIKDWLSLHLSMKINYQMIRGFLEKLLSLPISFFESKRFSEILKRITDHQTIELLLTTKLLNFIISTLTIIILSIILFNFNKSFFFLFLLTVIIYFGWNLMFLRKRQKLDWDKFDILVNEQSILLQTIGGIYDLKLYDSSAYLLDKWENNQKEKIKYQYRFLKISQIQSQVSWFIFQIFQVIIVYLAAELLIKEELSFGTVISLEFIIGQMISPITDIINLLNFGLEAKLCLQRIFDIWDTKSEILPDIKNEAIENGDIVFRQCSFKYTNQIDFFIKNLSLVIPKGKITAIVGNSGSGKSTILKLILGYYSNYEGNLIINNKELREMNIVNWRNRCGIISQNNYIFNDTIANNIALSSKIDFTKLITSLKISNLEDYVSQLPQNYDTIIGENGRGLSQGQQQRLFIARAIYKNPDYILLDEATNALDAFNESSILQNIMNRMKNKTIIMVAHRLSTIRNADNIIVINDGEISENGTHDDLMRRGGMYYNLIKKQL